MNRELSIGRAAENDILIPDNSVSRQHASLIILGNSFSVRDNGSSNGTYINGLKINGLAQLKNNDILKVGNALVPWMNYVNMAGKSTDTTVESVPQPQPTYQAPPMTDGTLSVPNSGGALTCGIIGLVLSVWGFIGIIGFILCILALALGASGTAAYKRDPSKYRRGSLSNAKAGIVLGIIGICLFLFAVIFIIALIA